MQALLKLSRAIDWLNATVGKYAIWLIFAATVISALPAVVRKAVNFLQVAEGKVVGVVENMSGLVCPHCHQELDLFKNWLLYT